jgi:hypothetical protein
MNSTSSAPSAGTRSWRRPRRLAQVSFNTPMFVLYRPLTDRGQVN